MVERLNNLTHLQNLEDFWVSRNLRAFGRVSHPNFLQFNGNKLAEWSDLDKQLAPLKQLNNVYLEHNPIYKDSAYRRKVMLALPQVAQIDATMCRAPGASGNAYSQAK